MRKLTLITIGLAASFAIACTDKGDTGDSGLDEADADADADADTDTDTDADMTISVTWGASSVDFAFSPSASDDLLVGIAETADSENPWTGEDCLNGFVLEGGDVLGPYCHAVGAGDTALSLAYGGDPNNLAAGTTVFDASFDGLVSYIVYDSTGACWTWGEDTSYYSGEGCTEM